MAQAATTMALFTLTSWLWAERDALAFALALPEPASLATAWTSTPPFTVRLSVNAVRSRFASAIAFPVPSALSAKALTKTSPKIVRSFWVMFATALAWAPWPPWLLATASKFSPASVRVTPLPTVKLALALAPPLPSPSFSASTSIVTGPTIDRGRGVEGHGTMRFDLTRALVRRMRHNRHGAADRHILGAGCRILENSNCALADAPTLPGPPAPDPL